MLEGVSDLPGCDRGLRNFGCHWKLGLSVDTAIVLMTCYLRHLGMLGGAARLSPYRAEFHLSTVPLASGAVFHRACTPVGLD